MSNVDKETFAYWITHPGDIGAANLPRLEAIARSYPYCQINYLLLAKAGADAGSPRLTEFVPKAAIYALNRNSLRQLVEGDAAWIDSPLNRLSDLSLGGGAVGFPSLSQRYYRDQATPYGHEKPMPLVSFEDAFAAPQQAVSPLLPAQQIAPDYAPPLDDTVASEREIEKELSQKKMRPAVQPGVGLLPDSQSLHEARRRQQEIIEAFIRNDPRIGPVRPPADLAEAPAPDLTERSQVIAPEGLATESFAKILLRQGKKDKALAIYEKLILKNPEKSEYFAQKIAELRDAP